jgi:hypothetical protein
MPARASVYLQSDGARGLLRGPASGLPYRVFVIEAYRLAIPLPLILFWTTLARFERILLAPVVVAIARGSLSAIAGRFFRTRDATMFDRVLVAIVGVYWVGLYGWYWLIFLPRTFGVM